MPVLTFTNVLGSDVAIGNADGYGKSFTIPPAGKAVTFTGVQLESCGPQLDAMKNAGYITWVKTDNAAVSDDLELLSGSAHATLLAAVVPAAKSANSVLDTTYGDAAGPVEVTAGLTNPVTPRNLRVIMGAAWDGGDVVVTGTNQFNAIISESFTTGQTVTRVGTKVFKTVTSVAYDGDGVGNHGTNTITVGTGDTIGIAYDVANTTALLWTDGTLEAVTIDATYDSFAPTTAPNGAHSYVLLANLM